MHEASGIYINAAFARTQLGSLPYKEDNGATDE